MILDALGQELHVGNLIMLVIPSPVIRATIIKVKDGGLIVPLNATQKGMIPDEIDIEFTLHNQLLDGQPGQRHPTVIRVPHPDNEVIITASKKDVS